MLKCFLVFFYFHKKKTIQLRIVIELYFIKSSSKYYLESQILMKTRQFNSFLQNVYFLFEMKSYFKTISSTCKNVEKGFKK